VQMLGSVQSVLGGVCISVFCLRREGKWKDVLRVNPRILHPSALSRIAPSGAAKADERRDARVRAVKCIFFFIVDFRTGVIDTIAASL